MLSNAWFSGSLRGFWSFIVGDWTCLSHRKVKLKIFVFRPIEKKNNHLTMIVTTPLSFNFTIDNSPGYSWKLESSCCQCALMSSKYCRLDSTTKLSLRYSIILKTMLNNWFLTKHVRFSYLRYLSIGNDWWWIFSLCALFNVNRSRAAEIQMTIRKCNRTIIKLDKKIIILCWKIPPRM